ncbi:MAG: NUDIX hydrolase N-terminal domain-containing protein, partial [Acidimicrobiales bacterium]
MPGPTDPVDPPAADPLAAHPADPPATPQDLVRWSEALAGIARTGLGFTENLYERERFEEVLAVAADMRVA